jgi:hypothetical protein
VWGPDAPQSRVKFVVVDKHIVVIGVKRRLGSNAVLVATKRPILFFINLRKDVKETHANVGLERDDRGLRTLLHLEEDLRVSVKVRTQSGDTVVLTILNHFVIYRHVFLDRRVAVLQELAKVGRAHLVHGSAVLLAAALPFQNIRNGFAHGLEQWRCRLPALLEVVRFWPPVGNESIRRNLC